VQGSIFLKRPLHSKAEVGISVGAPTRPAAKGGRQLHLAVMQRPQGSSFYAFRRRVRVPVMLVCSTRFIATRSRTVSFFRGIFCSQCLAGEFLRQPNSNTHSWSPADCRSTFDIYAEARAQRTLSSPLPPETQVDCQRFILQRPSMHFNWALAVSKYVPAPYQQPVTIGTHELIEGPFTQCEHHLCVANC
jgi:hypothetical protein